MRKVFFILSWFLSTSITLNAQNQYTLLPVNSHCNTVKSILYEVIDGGFCTTSIFIHSDSTFLYESGCEGYSEISMGSWKIVGDSIVFYTFRQSDINMVYCIQGWTKKKAGSKSTIQFYDKAGKPLKGMLVSLVRYDTFSNPSGVISSDINADSNAVKQVYTDQNGKLYFDIKEYPLMEVMAINSIVGFHYTISTAGMLGDFKVYLNAQEYAITAYPFYKYVWKDKFARPFSNNALDWGK